VAFWEPQVGVGKAILSSRAADEKRIVIEGRKVALAGGLAENISGLTIHSHKFQS
jgi:hypothetical protein